MDLRENNFIELKRRKYFKAFQDKEKPLRSISPFFKAHRPELPKSIYYQTFKSNLSYSVIKKVSRRDEIKSLYKVSFERLLASPVKELGTRGSVKGELHKKTLSLNNKFNKKEVLSIYGIKKRQPSISSQRANKITEECPNKDIEKYLDRLREKSKVLMRKMQESYRLNK